MSKTLSNYILELESYIPQFEIKNSLPSLRAQHENGGVGLENIQERLRLLFPDCHHLHINETAEEYAVNLNLNLSESCHTDA